MGCNECTHPTCPHALSQNGVSSCVECEHGVLVLEQTSAPKWRMACNKYVFRKFKSRKILIAFFFLSMNYGQ